MVFPGNPSLILVILIRILILLVILNLISSGIILQQWPILLDARLVDCISFCSPVIRCFHGICLHCISDGSRLVMGMSTVFLDLG